MMFRRKDRDPDLTADQRDFVAWLDPDGRLHMADRMRAVWALPEQDQLDLIRMRDERRYRPVDTLSIVVDAFAFGGPERIDATITWRSMSWDYQWQTGLPFLSVAYNDNGDSTASWTEGDHAQFISGARGPSLRSDTIGPTGQDQTEIGGRSGRLG